MQCGSRPGHNAARNYLEGKGFVCCRYKAAEPWDARGAAWLAACRGVGISKNSLTLRVSADGRVFVPSHFCEYITIFPLVINNLFFFYF